MNVRRQQKITNNFIRFFLWKFTDCKEQPDNWKQANNISRNNREDKSFDFGNK